MTFGFLYGLAKPKRSKVTHSALSNTVDTRTSLQVLGTTLSVCRRRQDYFHRTSASDFAHRVPQHGREQQLDFSAPHVALANLPAGTILEAGR